MRGRGKRVRVSVHVVPADLRGALGAGDRVIGEVAYVSPVGLEIHTEAHNQHFFFPWSNVTGVEYLNG